MVGLTIRITGVAHLFNQWLEILSEGWTTTPRRKVPPSAQRLAPRRASSAFTGGSASETSFK